jgi:lipopolysaccharide/colanic/teichoic acid biosynthesis glycosyltransferase
MSSTTQHWSLAGQVVAVDKLQELPRQSAFAYFLQRVVESVVAIFALALSTPVLLAIGLVIRRGTPGPAMFHQYRVGKNEEPFRFVKFRTLYHDARDRWPELYAYEYSAEQMSNLVFKLTNDPRVTPQGSWLRKSTLDELPNFWSVLVGDMALVGPRPEIPQMLKYYQGEHRLKFRVRPGVTGLAQISGRGRLGFYETADLDVEYVKNRSFWLDCKILFLTVVKIVMRDGAF